MAMLISVIVSSKYEQTDISALKCDISEQKIAFDTEVIKSCGINPPGKVRNEGVANSKGSILVFIDCDIRLGNKFFLANLVHLLLEDKNIGITCASIRIPPDSSKFQKQYAKQTLHAESPIVDSLTDIFVASSACCALRRDLFLENKGFNEQIIRGEDSLISFEIKKRGYRVVLIADTWCYHPQPRNMREIVKMNFRNGNGVAFVDMFYPQLNIDVNPEGIMYDAERQNKLQRIKRFINSFFKAVFKLKFLMIISKITYAVGYFFGLLKYKFFKRKR